MKEPIEPASAPASTTDAVHGPDFIALQVRDLDASRRFYEGVVGLRAAPQSPPHAFVFATEPIPFAVREPLVDLDLTPHLGHGVALWFRADDSPRLLDRLRSQGVEIVQELGDGPFGRTFTFRDPDGYLVTVHDRG